MGKLIDLTGKKFGRWTVVSRADNERSKACWLCRCECGTESVIRGSSLTSGHSKSCGCYRSEIIGKQNKTHGKSHTRLYSIWKSMKARCYNPDFSTYRFYGGCWITVCDEWKDNFDAFSELAHSHGYDENAPRGTCTIDRIDSSREYSPENCRWITIQEQQKNRKSIHQVTYHDKTQCIADWADELSLPYALLRKRIVYLGWTPEEAFETKSGQKRGCAA